MQTAPRSGLGSKGSAAFVITVLGVVAVVAAFSLAVENHQVSPGVQAGAAPQGVSAFRSYSELQAFMAANAKSAQQYTRQGISFGGKLGLPIAVGVGLNQLQAGVSFAAATTGAAPSTPSFTGTNVQVQGVDEPDRVKTDGAHLFVSTQDAVSIIEAYPPSSASTLSTISFPSGDVLGLEIAQGRLMVINQRNSGQGYVDLLLYDTTDLSSPRLIQNTSVAGSYVAARLAQGYAYAIVQQPSYKFDGQGNATATMPEVIERGRTTPIAPTSVYHTANSTQVSYYTMIASMSMSTGKENITSVLTGPSATIYVSTSSVYVVYTNYLDLYAADGIPGDVYTGGVITANDVQRAQNSTILRASYSSGTVGVAAAGTVPGTVLNQFSLDEYRGYFRVATSRFATVDGTPTRSDDIYVLDQGMKQVSALQNIAPGENIYAVRFVGDMGYVVTFEQIDPLFVISFKDMTNPTILSALKVTGYSDYLHPLPGGYLIGVGKDAVPSSTGNFAWYLGLKLSLFRVYDNGTSVQVSKYLIGDRGTDSPVLTDHLAFTFDSANGTMVIPVTLATVSGNQGYSPSSPPPYGDVVWQGVYVFRVNASGFDLLGRVSQYPAGQNFGDSPNNNLQIDRSVIIGDFLYTVSEAEVMVSSLSSPSFPTVATVPIPA